MPYFEKNIAILRELDFPRKSEILGKLRALKPPEAAATAQPDCPTIFVGAHGARRALHSTRDPVREARAWAGKFELEKAGGAVLAGVGLGYAAEAVVDLFPHIDPLILIEPTLDHFAAAMHYRDLSGILNNSRVRLILGPFALVSDALLALIDEMADPSRKFGVLAHPPSLAALPESERDFNEIFSYLRDTRRSANKPFSGLVEKNELKNRGAISESSGVSALFGRYQGVPAFLAAPGPSLNKNIALLGQAAKLGVVVGLDASLIPLMRAGATPDFVFCMDPQDKVKKYFAAGAPKTTRLVFFPGSFPEIVHLFSAQQRYWAHPETDLDRCGNASSENTLFASGSVFVSALDFCRRAGCNPIVLLGADFAVRPDGTHVGSSPANKRTTDDADKRQCTGFFGTPVTSRPDYYIYMRQTEHYLASIPAACTVWNATEGGATVAGTESICLRDGIFRITSRSHTGRDALIP